jgi:xanthine dehydrogenase YagR molybdenum-binding subunit
MSTVTEHYLQRPVSRVDGRLKVTGGARYAAEFTGEGLVHGVVVSSTIATGCILSIDASAALAADGVLHVMTHENRPALATDDNCLRDAGAPAGSPFRPLDADRIWYSGQPVALVLAESFEAARYGASLVAVRYEPASHCTDLETAARDAYSPAPGKDGFEPPPEPRGDADAALQAAPVHTDHIYRTPVEHHNPMEMHASTVIRHPDGKLTIYDKTQGVQNSKQFVTRVFGLRDDEVEVISPFVGGAFGSGLRPQYQLVLAVMAARELRRSVRVVLTRQQMFTFGHRPQTIQRVALGADAQGRLQAVIQEVVSETSRFEDYVEVIANWAGQLYQCDNVRLDYKVAKIDAYTPLDMRAPGATPGVYALETAMDELAHAAGVDPLELRLVNYAERDQNKDKPFSSKALRECYRQGAERFGWSRRPMAPRSMRDGNTLIGWGMATGIWDAMQMPAQARASLDAQGRLVVASASADIGTGTYTVMTQISADAMGLPMERVEFRLGDSSMPAAPLEGGSWTVSSVGSAVVAACAALRERLAEVVRQIGVAHASAKNLSLHDDHLVIGDDGAAKVSLAELVRAAGGALEANASVEPDKKQEDYSMGTHSAVFVEVRVDEALGTVTVSRVVSAIAAGRIVNPKTAGNQIAGGVVWGIGMALQEETMFDDALGRPMNHNLSEYHVPVNADVHDIDVLFVEEKDEIVNPLGVKGVGEVGLVGVAAAIGNAIFHATGRRLRDLPFTPDKVIAPPQPA